MNGNKVLITGTTGFLGSHISRKLLSSVYELCAIKRSSSSLSRCMDYADRIQWINNDDENLENKIHKFNPDILIHAGWDGLLENDRNNWKLQLSNFRYSTQLFDLAIETGVKKIIALGSQAEYGNVSFRTSEELVPVPDDAYGAVKLLTYHNLRMKAIRSNTAWNWLRIYSVFGPYQNPTAILPIVIQKLITGTPVDLTLGEQRYDFLYIEDFLSAFQKVFDCTANQSGVYNLGSGQSIRIRDLLLELVKVIKVEQDLLRFGSLPYRTDQTMFMESNTSKFIANFGEIPLTTLNNALNETVSFYLSSK